MLIDNRPIAPHIGCWQLTMHTLPSIDVIVVGLGWCVETGKPVIAFLRWMLVEDGPDWDEADLEDFAFTVSDEEGEEKQAVWVAAYDTEHGPVMPPCAWAEARFVIPLPARVCADCNGLQDECCEDHCEDDDG